MRPGGMRRSVDATGRGKFYIEVSKGGSVQSQICQRHGVRRMRGRGSAMLAELDLGTTGAK